MPAPQILDDANGPSKVPTWRRVCKALLNPSNFIVLAAITLGVSLLSLQFGFLSGGSNALWIFSVVASSTLAVGAVAFPFFLMLWLIDDISQRAEKALQEKIFHNGKYGFLGYIKDCWRDLLNFPSDFTIWCKDHYVKAMIIIPAILAFIVLFAFALGFSIEPAHFEFIRGFFEAVGSVLSPSLTSVLDGVQSLMMFESSFNMMIVNFGAILIAFVPLALADAVRRLPELSEIKQLPPEGLEDHGKVDMTHLYELRDCETSEDRDRENDFDYNSEEASDKIVQLLKGSSSTLSK